VRHLQSRQRGGRANKRNRAGRGDEQRLKTANGEEGFADIDAGIDLEEDDGDFFNAKWVEVSLLFFSGFRVFRGTFSSMLRSKSRSS